MKKPIALVCVVILSLLAPSMLGARELYQLHWRGIRYKPDSTGRVVAVRYTERDIIAKCAADNGLTDLKALAFVYVADDQDTEVVLVATGQTVADIYQLEYQFTEAPNFDRSQVVRQSFLFSERYESAIGSAFGIEHSRRDINGDRIGFSYRGSFQFSLPDDGAIYSGTFSTGKRLRTTE